MASRMRIVPSAGHVARVLRDVEAHAHVALRAEMIDFIRPDAVDEPREVQRVGKIAVVQEEAHAVDVRIGVEVVDARGVEGAGAADDAVDFVALLEQQIGEVGAVLAGDAGDECFFHDWKVQRPDGFTDDSPRSGGANSGSLRGDQLCDAFFSEREHGGQFGFGEGLLLARALHLDELAVPGHHEVHVHGGVLVLEVIEVEQRLAVHDAHAHGGDELA